MAYHKFVTSKHSIAARNAAQFVSDALTCLACKVNSTFTSEVELTICCLNHFALQAELEDEILQLLSSATGNLLDNVQLINTLNASKTTWEQVNQSLQVCSHLVMLMPCLHCSQLQQPLFAAACMKPDSTVHITHHCAVNFWLCMPAAAALRF